MNFETLPHPAFQQIVAERFGEDILFLPDRFNLAVMGFVLGGRFGTKPSAVYNSGMVVQILMDSDGMARDEAQEYFAANIECADMGEGTPVFVTQIQME